MFANENDAHDCPAQGARSSFSPLSCCGPHKGFRHPNLLALEDYTFAAGGKEAILLFDYFQRGTLLQLVQSRRHERLWASSSRVLGALVCPFVLVLGEHLSSYFVISTRCFRLAEQEILRLFLGLCAGVSVLHSHVPPLAHRDIKPANVLLSDDGISVLMVRAQLRAVAAACNCFFCWFVCWLHSSREAF